MDCAAPEGYLHHVRTRWYVADPAAGPWRFCIQGVDSAGNAGPVLERTG